MPPAVVAEEGADAESDYDDAHIFSEESPKQIKDSRAYIMDETKLADDTAVHRIILQPAYSWLTQQLVISGRRWEERQQRSQEETGSRSYRVLVAYDSEQTFEMLASMSLLMFGENDRWSLVQQRTEALQKQAFLQIARVVAMAYQLVFVRNRNYPYKAFHALRDDAIFAEIKSAEDCIMDDYTRSVKQYYGDHLGSAANVSEFELLRDLIDTDTISTERAHSVNSMKTAYRSLTHKLDLTTMDAHFVCRQARGKEPDSIRNEQVKRKPAAAPKKTDGKVKRPGGGGAWRAFVHIEAKGKRCTPGFFTELSERFRSLSDEQREYYEELGEIARQLHRDGRRGFGRRIRKKSAPPQHDDQDRGPEGPTAAADAAPSDGANAASTQQLARITMSDAKLEFESSSILRGAISAQRAARGNHMRDRTSEMDTVRFLEKRDSAAAKSEAQHYGLDTASEAPQKTSASWEYRGGVLRWEIPPTDVKEKAASRLPEGTQSGHVFYVAPDAPMRHA